MTQDKIVKIDKFIVGSKYAITINPDNDHQFFGIKADDRVIKAVEYMKSIARAYPNISLEMALDISCRGRIHWHGVLTVFAPENIKVLYLEFIPYLLKGNQIEIDTIEDDRVWDEYCHKIKHIYNINVTTKEVTSKKLPYKAPFKDITHY